MIVPSFKSLSLYIYIYIYTSRSLCFPHAVCYCLCNLTENEDSALPQSSPA